MRRFNLVRLRILHSPLDVLSLITEALISDSSSLMGSLPVELRNLSKLRKSFCEPLETEQGLASFSNTVVPYHLICRCFAGILFLQNNTLTGSLPSEFSMMTNLSKDESNRDEALFHMLSCYSCLSHQMSPYCIITAGKARFLPK